MKYVAPVRKELGIRTIFNILGPLTNPAGASMQLMGVYEEALVEPMAKVLMNLALKKEWSFTVRIVWMRFRSARPRQWESSETEASASM